MLDTSITYSIWPAIGLLVALSLLGGAIVGRALGQWRMFVIATVSIWAFLGRFNGLSLWIDVLVLIGGMVFYVVAWFRERERSMGNVTN